MGGYYVEILQGKTTVNALNLSLYSISIEIIMGQDLYINLPTTLVVGP
jgi:hypothetical protein